MEEVQEYARLSDSWVYTDS